MSRGVEGRPIFIDDLDRKLFLAKVSRYSREMGVRILAYCLMTNHFHFAVQVGKCPISSFMQRLEGGYASFFNFRHGRVGHLFQSRFKANICLADRYLTTLIHYIHMNPVRAGLVLNPGDWRWSDYTPTEHNPDLTDFEPWALQGPALVRPTRLEPDGMDSIGEAVAFEHGESVERLKSRIKLKPLVIARRAFVMRGLTAGHTLASMARWLNTTRSTVGRYAAK